MNHDIELDSMKLSDVKDRMRVRYVPKHANGDINHKDCENGTVSSKNSQFVFVKFDRELTMLGWAGATSQACDPRDLTHLIK